MTIDFQFDLCQEVRVKPIRMIGVVDSMSLDNNGKQYRVVYWNDGTRHSVWLYAWEIEAT